MYISIKHKCEMYQMHSICNENLYYLVAMLSYKISATCNKKSSEQVC